MKENKTAKIEIRTTPTEKQQIIKTVNQSICDNVSQFFLQLFRMHLKKGGKK